MFGNNSGPNLTNSIDIVANSIALAQNTSQQDITDIFASNSDVTRLFNSINKTTIGLGNVANTAPSDLPISTATQQALNNINRTSLSIFNVANTAPSYFATAASVNAITPASLGLGNVANTAPSALPISIATQQALTNINRTSLSIFNVANTAPSYFASAAAANNELFKKFFHAMLNRGIYLPPSAFESWFLNNALSYEDLDKTILAVEESLKEIL